MGNIRKEILRFILKYDRFEWFVFAGIFLFYISELFNSLLFDYQGKVTSIAIGSFVRGTVMGLFLFFSFESFLKHRIIGLLLLGFIVVVFLGHYMTFGVNGIVSMTNALGRYVSLIVFLVFFSLKTKFNSNQVIRIANFIISIALFNGVLAVCGWMFQIDFFRSYNQNRFGYNGLFFWANDSTSFYVISTLLCLFLYLKVSKSYSTHLLFLLFFGVFLGTKAYLLFVFFFLCIMLFVNNKRLLMLVLVVLPLLACIVFLTMPFYTKVSNSSGLIYAISSGRSSLIEIAWQRISDTYTFANYLLGTGDIKVFLTETDLIDLFLFSGIIGGIVYLYLVYWLIRQRHVFNFVNISSLIVLLIISSSAGHLIGNGVNSLMLAFLLYLFFCVEPDSLRRAL